MQKIPTTVFAGFLGSGKTTIISHLVDTLQKNGQQVIYIKNEIGDENIDGQLMQGKNIQTKELLNGCICCTLVGPFMSAIDEIIEKFQPDRVLIEASGAADPAAIALMIDSHPRLTRDGVISIIDVVNFEGYKNLSLTAQNQTKFTDLLVFNKVELADFKRKEAVVGYVRELNNHSPVVEAAGGILRPEVAFGVSTAELTSLLEEEKTEHDAGHDEHHHHDHLEVDGIESFHVTFPGRIEEESFRKYLQTVPGSIYRIKGFVHLDSGKSAIVNKVGSRITFDEPPASVPSEDNSIVCIGFRISRLKEEVAARMRGLAQ